MTGLFYLLMTMIFVVSISGLPQATKSTRRTIKTKRLLRCSSHSLPMVRSVIEPISSDDRTALFEKESKLNRKVETPYITHAYISGLRGLVTTGAIAKGQAAIKVPLQFSITAGLAGQGPGKDSIPNTIVRGTDRLAVAMLLEWQQKQKSTYFEYLNMLPRSSFGPLHWSNEVIDKFPYTAMIVSVKKQRSEWESLYQTIKSTVPNLKNLSARDFSWAMEMVASRSFQGELSLLTPSQRVASLITGLSTALFGLADLTRNYWSETDIPAIALVAIGVLLGAGPTFINRPYPVFTLHPYIDSANHNQAQPQGTLSLSPVQDYYEVITTEAVPANTEFRISYGDRHNDDLLQYYGFVESNNQCDRYVIVNAQEKLQQLLSSKQSLTEQNLMIFDEDSTKVQNMNIDFLKKTTLVLPYSISWDVILPRVKEFITSNLSDSDIKRAVLELIKVEKRTFLSRNDIYLARLNTLPQTIPSLYQPGKDDQWYSQAPNPIPIVQSFLSSKIKLLDHSFEVLSK